MDSAQRLVPLDFRAAVGGLRSAIDVCGKCSLLRIGVELVVAVRTNPTDDAG